MRRLIILLTVLLGATIGCSQTIRNSPMIQDQANLIRSNWESLRKGMSIEEVKNLLGPPTVYRIKDCDCKECAPLGAEKQKLEKCWYVYEPVSDPNVFKKRDDDDYFYVYLEFRHGRLFAGKAETNSGAMLLK